MLFAGKKALVTGAASGIGRATAIRFAAEGATLTIGDRNLAGLEETAAMIAAAGGTAPVVQAYDATDYASCRALVDTAARDGLDIVCNIAGLLKWGRSETFSAEDFDLLMHVNATSVFVICQAAIPHLLKSKGNIVNTASTAALQGQPYNAAYSASKHAVAAITKGLAIEYAAAGVRINAICPGHVVTPMTVNTAPPEGVDWALMMRNAPKLLDGSCEPEDIAEMFAFLASDKARKITGSLFTVDGGQLAG
ncbi:SDR family NAD(P)-dependent oxidoreductase [Novosphingobium jiangmenense]|uniref:SDR family oxidoreductase n=1 Tax=Novosphingobium jiangmenense TaxID=2791981 RepID=A0ABS0HCS1_9SPHN|nr:SDR family NAD(P)-dependent oxidoreductase [Novosphingobium jiangmenense]MBF9149724.1 SDR family oxidoreductase [Novosphingobium jiangmenense]